MTPSICQHFTTPRDWECYNFNGLARLVAEFEISSDIPNFWLSYVFKQEEDYGISNVQHFLNVIHMIYFCFHIINYKEFVTF